MFFAGVGGLMGAGLQQFQFYLQRSIPQQTGQLGFRINLGRHQVQNQNLKRSDVLGHGTGIRHNEYILCGQRFNGR